MIRELGVRDYDAIFALWKRSGLSSLRPEGRDSREDFTRQMATGVQTVLGLEADGQLIGVVVTSHDGRKGWINRLAVDPGHQRRGLGIRLVGAAETLLRSQGIRVIAVLIEGDNEPSIALFKRAGYLLARDIVYMSKRDSPEA